MGNPQERSLAWLAGIIEAEGSITAQVYTMPNKRIRITPFICVVNTDMVLLKEVHRLLGLLTKRSKPRWCKHKGTNKPSAMTRLDGIGCADVISAIRPFMVGEKTKNADVILAFVADRKENLLSRNKLGQVQRKPYTAAQVDLVCSIRTHKQAKSSETLRRAPNVVIG